MPTPAASERPRRLAATAAAAAVAAAGALAAPAPAATAEIPIPILYDPLECVVPAAAGARPEVRGSLLLQTEDDANYAQHPAGYRFTAAGASTAQTGDWSWDGRRLTLAGPAGTLAAGAVGTPPAVPARMPGDPLRSRTFPLVLRGTQDGAATTWFCGARGYRPDVLVGAAALARTRRIARIPVPLPSFFRPSQQTPNGRTGMTAKVVTARRGEWRLQLRSTPCPAGSSGCPEVVFGAKVLAGRRPYRATPIRLADGVVGTQNTPGCGFDPEHAWAPYFCGQRLVSWTRGGVEYMVQMNSSEPGYRELRRYADAMITHS